MKDQNRYAAAAVMGAVVFTAAMFALAVGRVLWQGEDAAEFPGVMSGVEAAALADGANDGPGSDGETNAVNGEVDLAPPAEGPVATDGNITYNQHIRPILSNNCFSCHGPDANARHANLRLDTFEGATDASRGRAAIVPGDAEASEAFRRITTSNPDDQMPPASVEIEDPVGQAVTVSHDPLQPEQQDLVRRWIDAGAEYEEHWAYLPPERPETPDVEQTDWPRNEIDHFILAPLEARGIEPAAEADRETLLRRVTLDLTGLPPTPEEMEAFLEDESPDAYQQAIDRLLASEAYGERMAVHWLDQVRYADTTGYHSDETQPVWAYRDYVIRAFNDNMPFDQFTREQLAGDLLEDPSEDQLIASGFNRLNLTTAEGGAQEKEYLAMYMADRVEATGSAFMGASMSCAQCHDHKYDPYTIKDFYSFGAFFADIQEPGVYSHETVREPSMEYVQREYRELLDQLREELKETDEAFALRDSELDAFDAWRADLRERVAQAEPREEAWLRDRVDDVGGFEEVQGDWNYISADDGPVHRGEVSRLQQADGLEQHYVRAVNEPIQAEEDTVIYCWVWLDPENPPAAVMLQFHTRENGWAHRAAWGEDVIPYGRNDDDNPGHLRMGSLPAVGEWTRLAVPASSVGVVGLQVDGAAFTQHDGAVYWDELGFEARSVEGVPIAVSSLADHSFDELNEDQQQAFTRQFRRETEPERFVSLDERRAELEREHDGIMEKGVVHQVLITQARDEPRETRVLPRGNWMDDSGEVVEPAVPAFLGSAKTEEGRATRLDLAEWLVSEENPLIARAVTNRFWALFFGEGLSRSPDDLGSQGEMPTHPGLLDWLGVEFRESGWDVKHMVRLMVTSQAYRQSSQPRPELREADPDNRLLARQIPRRLDAEFVRDNALAAAGLLHTDMFGPPIMPYQPEGHWDHLNFPRRTYEHDEDENQWRRGVYIHRQRTFLHPMLMAFDAPSREMCVAYRNRSNTPSQALVLLNDPSFVEAARVFAEQILQRPEETPEERAAWAFRRALARDPEARELDVLKTLYENHLRHYREHPEEAEELLQVGIWEGPDSLDPVEIAAWTSVARTTLNLHETITRY